MAKGDGRGRELMKVMRVCDLVRYQQGSLDKVGVVTGQKQDGDYLVQFVDGRTTPCRWRTLEVIGESR